MRAVALIALAGFAGCFYDAPYVEADVSAAAGAPAIARLRLGVTLVAAGKHTSVDDPQSPLTLPRSLGVKLPPGTRDNVRVTADGLDGSGSVVASGGGAVTVGGNGMYHVAIVLAGGAGNDLGAPASCDAALAGDPLNCGGCGVVCSSAHIANPSCQNGACNGACDPGWDNCDNSKQQNGCNVAVAADPNCGACGVRCASPLVCAAAIAPAMLSAFKFNGNASYDAVNAVGVVTPGKGQGESGSIFYPNPSVADEFVATFEFRITPVTATTADGMGFMIVTDGATKVGRGGGELGMMGLNGYAIELDTYQNTGSCNEPNNNHVGVDYLAMECNANTNTVKAEGTLAFTLTDGKWHTAAITFSRGNVSVSLDGKAYLQSVAVPFFTAGTKYYFGFGAASGGFYERHEIRNVGVTFPSSRCL